MHCRSPIRGFGDDGAPGAEYETEAREREEASWNEAELGDTVAVLSEKAERLDRGHDGASSPNGATEGGWAVLPDLVVIDGGKGQLSSAQEVMELLGLLDIPMISLAKKDEEIFLPGRSEPVVLEFRSEALKLLQRVRDEAHRFSNTYNKKLGAKRGIQSKLDWCPASGLYARRL